jgi:polygalacturonase
MMRLNHIVPLVIIVVSSTTMLSASTPVVNPPVPTIPDRKFVLTEFGGVGDGKTINTRAFHKAMEAAAKAGGGRIVVPAGQFVSGPIELGNNIDLYLAKGAVLLMSLNVDDFPVENNRHSDFIFAIKSHDVRISGEGTIDGQGAPWWTAFRGKQLTARRPQMIRLTDCERVELNGFATLNPPNTHCSLGNCTDVTIRGLTMVAPGTSPNTDALNVSGKNYLITNCKINTGDDNIVLVGHGGNEPTENFNITGCSLGVGHGLSIGSHTAGGVRNVRVESISFEGTTSGIRTKAGRDRGGLVENLSYKNITMKDVKYPIFISSYYPKEPKNPTDDSPRAIGPLTPIWRNIKIENATITDAKESVIIWGVPELPISDITLKNVKVSAENGMRVFNAKNIRFAESEIEVKSGPKLTTYQAQVEGVEGVPFQAKSGGNEEQPASKTP